MNNNLNKLDIYQYFSLQDDADYWRKSGKTFSPLEMAVIVYRSNCTINQKHEAYRIIVREYEDEWVTSPKFEFPGLKVSLHKALTHIIEDEQQRIHDFLVTEDRDSVFQLAYHVKSEITYDTSECRGSVFSSFKNVIEDLKTEESDNDSGEVRFYTVYKYYIDDLRYDECCVNLNGEIIFADGIGSYDPYGYRYFENCWNGFLANFYIEIPKAVQQGILNRIYHRIIHR